MTALFAGKMFGVLSLAAVGVASTALVVGVLVLTGAAGIHGLNGLNGTNGADGAPGTAGANGQTGAAGGSGANGAQGANGAPGSDGSSGASSTWGTLSLSFSLSGATSGLTIQGATCPSEGHGAYACLITVQNSGTSLVKVTGLNYAQSTAVYYAGADPTLGSIALNPGSTTEFTLWFQAVQYTGNANVAVTLLVGPGGA